MQIVHHRRMPFEDLVGDVLGELQILAEPIAVVVVRDIFAPIDERRLGLAGLLAIIISVDDLLAPVDLDHRGDEGDHIVADVADERRILDREAIGEFDQHLGPAGLGRMVATGHPVDRLGGLDDLGRLGGIGAARITERGELQLILVELGQRLLVGDRDNDLLAPFLGRSHRHIFDALGGPSEFLVIPRDIRRIGEFAGRAGDAAEEFERRRHRIRRRHMIDQFGGEALVDQILVDQLAIFGILRLGQRTDRRRQRGLGSQRLGERQRGGKHGCGKRRSLNREANPHRKLPLSCDLLVGTVHLDCPASAQSVST
jgi:hypothetical protein